VPGDTVEELGAYVGRQQRTDELGVDDAGVQQRLSERAATRQRGSVAVREAVGDAPGKGGAVGVQAGAGEQDDAVSGGDVLAEYRLAPGRHDPERAACQFEAVGGHKTGKSGGLASAPGRAGLLAGVLPARQERGGARLVRVPVGISCGEIGCDHEGGRADRDHVVDDRGDGVDSHIRVPVGAALAKYPLGDERLRAQLVALARSIASRLTRSRTL
jgi:hypothetical protein